MGRLHEVNQNNKALYLLRIGSHKIFNGLAKYGVHPRKSLTIELPEIPKRYIGNFVRGYFDGDGCIYLEKTKTKSIKCMRSIFSSGSKKFLSELANLLAYHYQFTQKKIYKGQRSYQLRYNTRDSIKLFFINVW